ncbi:MAG: AmmeMemoRadiSam system radical SAM enzyme [Lentihominibacter sp.]|jgi:pyruvate formate lyase activating enzyme
MNEKIVCEVCPRKCSLSEGETGFCRARTAVGGKIKCTAYGKITSIALDPIEKKPLARFHQGSRILSVGSFGCNMNCAFCQNSDIAMRGEDETAWNFIPPSTLAEKAAELMDVGNIGVAFTYNEPGICYEYIIDAGRLIHRAGMKNVMVTNGCFSQTVCEELLEVVDAMNIDLKGFSEEYYRKLGGDLETVKAFIRTAAAKCHVELTTLIVTGDSIGNLREMVEWIASIDLEIPLHISRFFPRHRMSQKEPTPVREVYRIAEMARENLRYVYTGNC